MSALVVEVDRRKTYVDEDADEGSHRLVLVERFPPDSFQIRSEADGWDHSIEEDPEPGTVPLSSVEQSIVVTIPEAAGLYARVMWGTGYGFREPAMVFHMDDVRVVVAPLQVDAPSIDLTWEKLGFIWLRILKGLDTTASWHGSPSALLVLEKERRRHGQGVFGHLREVDDVLWSLNRVGSKEMLRVFPHWLYPEPRATFATEEARTLLALIAVCREELVALSDLVNPTKLDPYQPVEQVASRAKAYGIGASIAFFAGEVAPLLTGEAFMRTNMCAVAESMREEFMTSVVFGGEEKAS